jgi:hypothetical protein
MKVRARVILMFRKVPHWLRRQVGTDALTSVCFILGPAHIHSLIASPCRLPHAPVYRPLLSYATVTLPSFPFPSSYFPAPSVFHPSLHVGRYDSRSPSARRRPRISPRFPEPFHACRSGTPRYHPPSELRNFDATQQEGRSRIRPLCLVDVD